LLKDDERSLNLYRQEFPNNIGDIVIEALICPDIFLLFLSSPSSYIMRKEKNKKKRIKHHRHIEVLMTTSLISSERSRHNKSNDKKNHKQ
jgi:hypothetical protein